MVSILERTLCYTALAGLYTWGFYKYNTTKKIISDSLFEKVKVNALKYLDNNKDENIKFIDTFDKKLLFLIGVENNLNGLKMLKNLNSLTENFVFDHMLSEKQINK